MPTTLEQPQAVNLIAIPQPKFRLFQSVSQTYTADVNEDGIEETITDLGVVVGISWDTCAHKWMYDVNFSPDFSLITDIAVDETEITAIGIVEANFSFTTTGN